MLTTRQLAVGLLTLALSGCAQDRPSGQRPERPLALREHVGQKVTLRGRFSLRGKQAPFVLVGDEPVYLVADASFTWGEPYVGMEDRDVTIVGVLRRSEPPRTAPPVPDSVQQLPPYFFFDMRDTTISVANVERQQR